VRGQKVMLDADLAQLYGVPTKRFNEQVKRNLGRFPADFMFRLTHEEHAVLRSQLATSNVGRGGRRYLPYAFTEHGAIMAATILNSSEATEMSRLHRPGLRPAARNAVHALGTRSQAHGVGTQVVRTRSGDRRADRRHPAIDGPTGT